MIQLAHHINEKLVTIGLWLNSSLELKLLFHFNKKVSLDLAQVHSHSSAPLKFLGRFLVYLRMLNWIHSAYNYFVYWNFVRILWCIIQNGYVEDGRRWMVTSLVFSLSLFSHTHEAWLSSVSTCVALSLSFSLVLMLILGCCMLGCCVFVRSGTNMER